MVGPSGDRKSLNGGRVYTTVEVARLCNVTQRAVIYWIDKGKLKAYRTPGGHRRIPEGDLKAFMSAYKIPMESDEAGRRILVVDDERGFVDMVRRLIQLIDTRYEVAAAHTGFDAGFMVSRWKPDLILLDVRLPEMDGYEVCQTLRANPETRDIAIVAISGACEPGVEEKILECGAREFLAKPLGYKALADVLQRYAAL